MAAHRASTFLLAALLSACTPTAELFVDLRTDLRPGIEFASVVVELHGSPSLSDATRSSEPLAVGADDDLLEGVRVAELGSVPSGTWFVRARLRDGAGQDVAEHVVAVELLEERRIVTAVVTRDCIGVACPGDGSATAIACLGGECVEPTCSPETPDLCPPAECTQDSECPGGAVACAVGACVAGTCGTRADDALCDAASCHPQRGCEAHTQLRAGAHHTCALLNGDAYCWGTPEDGDTMPAPTRVEGLPTGAVTLVDPGAGHTCAIAEERAYCWGVGYNGELGDGAERSSATPVEVTALPSPVRDISAGLTFTCAIAGAGVYCWGSDGNGRLGNGPDVGSSDVPVEVVLDPADAALAEQVVAGGDHACLRLSDGRGFCWGHNDDGAALGTGDETIEASEIPLPVLATSIAEIDIAGWHGCALDTSGGLVCWGTGSRGMLGDGEESSSSTPVQPVGLDSSVTAFDVGGGPEDLDSTCAIQGGALRCFGANQYGSLGDGTTATGYTPVSHMGFGLDAVQVALGWNHGCALLTDGTIHCWGRGDLGQLGDGAMSDELRPVRIFGP